MGYSNEKAQLLSVGPYVRVTAPSRACMLGHTEKFPGLCSYPLNLYRLDLRSLQESRHPNHVHCATRYCRVLHACPRAYKSAMGQIWGHVSCCFGHLRDPASLARMGI